MVKAITVLQPKLSNKEVAALANAILKVSADDTCKVPWQILLSIAFHESSLRKNAVNTKSKDYGLMQISSRNISQMRLDKRRIMKDEHYSLKAACTILSYNRTRYADKVNFWLGIYRSGTALWNKRIVKNAVDYDRVIRTTASKLGYTRPYRELANNEKISK